ncbi:hypothetical protein [Streptomyces sp. NPDC088141]
MATFNGPLPRGVNLLVRSYQRNCKDYRQERMYMDVQVDHRDP